MGDIGVAGNYRYEILQVVIFIYAIFVLFSFSVCGLVG